jgi:hypothetical protein
VTPESYDAGYYPKAYAALHRVVESVPFWTAHFSDVEIP